MRTTVDLRADTRALIATIAARRGSRGVSAIVQEALDDYLSRLGEEDAAVAEIEKLAGTLSDAEADRMRATVQEVRASWR